MIKKFWLHTKRRWLPYLIAYTAKMGMRLLMRTCRIDIQGLDHFVNTASQGPCILSLWHNRLALLPEIMTKSAPQFIYTAFISKSRDGDSLALLTQSYSVGRVLRVAHNARHHALNQMIQRLKQCGEIMLITPDGPRGPRYEVKPGIIVAAQEAEAKVVPFSWQVNRAWELSTWDKMLIPKPFSKITVSFGPALSFTKSSTTDTDLKRETTRLQETLMAMQP